MHEFSICQTLVDAVIDKIKKIEPRPVRLIKTRVVVGKLRQVVPEYMEQAYEIITKETIAEGSELEIQFAPITGKCKDCGWGGEMPKGEFCCQSCGSVKAEIIGGREFYLKDLEVET